MPAPLMHVALALIALKGPFSNANKKDFIVGTSFPDIRYLKIIDRKQTHEKHVSWECVEPKQSDFKLGYLFHSWIDSIFDEFIRDNNIPQKFHAQTYSTQSFKFFADKIIYNKIKSSFAEVGIYFDNINKEELSFGIEKDAVIHWHKFLKQYCIQGDLYAIAQEYAILPKTTLDLLATDIAQIDKQKYLASKIVDDFYDFTCKKITEIKLLKPK